MSDLYTGLVAIAVGVLMVLFRKYIRHSSFNAMFDKTPASLGQQRFNGAFGVGMVIAGFWIIWKSLRG